MAENILRMNAAVVAALLQGTLLGAVAELPDGRYLWIAAPA